MRFRSGRAVAAGAAAAVAVTSVAVAAAPPISSSGRHTQRAARADLKDPTRKSIPQTSQARPVAASTTRARAQLRDSLGRYAQVTVDQQTGGLQAVGRLDGYLTGRSSASATSIALGYVRAHAAAFGLTQQDLDGLKLVRDYTSSPDGVRHLQWAQVVDGITVADSSVLANVASDGRLVNVLGGARGGTLNRRSPAVSADGAYQRTLRSVGSRWSVPKQRSARSTGSRETTYAGSGKAQLVAYHAGPGLRLAWRVLAPVSADGTYDSLVDAADGRIARRANLVKFADALVFDAAPGDHPGGTQTRKPIGQWLAPGADHLEGDNAHAFADVRDEVGPVLTEDGFADRFTPPSDGDVPPSSGSDWLYPIQSVPDATGECPGRRPRLHVEPHGAGLVAAQPQRGDDAALLLRQQVPRPPARRADRLRRGLGQLPGRRQGVRAVRRRRRHRRRPAGRRHIRQREHVDTPPDGTRRPHADVPVRATRSAGVQIRPRGQRRRRRGDRLPRVHARPLEPPDHRRARATAPRPASSPARWARRWSDWYALDFLARAGLRARRPGARRRQGAASTSTTGRT